MTRLLLLTRIAVLAVAVLLIGACTGALAQSTMVKGKVVDAERQADGRRRDRDRVQGRRQPQAADQDRQARRVHPAADRIRASTTSPRPTEDRHRPATTTKVSLGRVAEMNIVLVPSTAANDAAKAAELKKAFEEGVQPAAPAITTRPSRSSKAALAMAPSCFDCHYNIGVAYMAKKDEKAAEAAWKKALEVKADYAEALNALVDALQQPEALRRGGGDERQGGAPRAAAAATPTRSSTRASSSGTRARLPRPRPSSRRRSSEPEPRRRALSARHGAAERRQAARGGRRVRDLPEAGARRPVRGAGQGDDRAAEEVKS